MKEVNAKNDVKKKLGSELIETLDQLYYQTYRIERLYFEQNIRDHYKELSSLLGLTLVKSETTPQGQ